MNHNRLTQQRIRLIQDREASIVKRYARNTAWLDGLPDLHNGIDPIAEGLAFPTVDDDPVCLSPQALLMQALMRHLPNNTPS